MRPRSGAKPRALHLRCSNALKHSARRFCLLPDRKQRLLNLWLPYRSYRQLAADREHIGDNVLIHWSPCMAFLQLSTWPRGTPERRFECHAGMGDMNLVGLGGTVRKWGPEADAAWTNYTWSYRLL